ncbi:hypothetical protein [Frigoribacterium faeni]|uniref:Uncharacterized protein n=1 Tax=Frigoribacterium faeni TaxID=145483 RepID=A0A7W3JH35_9MICO|nr:hypothetical protein [Frigoribacterium faeni]MBA8812762.1 hypothetical protein [Frigoribacterium faeni]GEK82388.1 hypothetical protein FFA01_06970 [Frigoribacterium faeni]
MTDDTDLLRTDADAPAEFPVNRFRSTFVEPTPTPAPSAAPTQQEHHPVSQILAPEARPSLAPRPSSVPSHRADVPAAEVVANEVTDVRPLSVPRHSVDTSAITLPVFAVPVAPDLPQPPERVTLDDDVLARLVGERFDDTATVDLMAVVQAQMLARRAEAARFARWENEISRVGTDEAAQVLARTRLRFTGVIDVVGALPITHTTQTAASPDDLDDSDTNLIPIVTPEEVAADLALRRESARQAEIERTGSGPVVVDAATIDGAEPAAALRGPTVAGQAPPAPVDETPSSTGVAPQGHEASDHEASGHEASGHEASGLAGVLARTTLPVRLVVGASLAVVVAALVLAGVDGESLATAVVATLAVPLLGGLAGTGALVAVSVRRATSPSTVLDRRGPSAVVAAVVVASGAGFGILSPVVAALGWQGYLAASVGASGLGSGVAVPLALVASAVVAFVVAVLVTGVRSSARD